MTLVDVTVKTPQDRGSAEWTIQRFAFGRQACFRSALGVVTAEADVLSDRLDRSAWRRTMAAVADWMGSAPLIVVTSPNTATALLPATVKGSGDANVEATASSSATKASGLTGLLGKLRRS